MLLSRLAFALAGPLACSLGLALVLPAAASPILDRPGFRDPAMREQVEAWNPGAIRGAVRAELNLRAALAALNANRLDEAITLTTGAIARDGLSAPALELLGTARALQGNLPAAEEALAAALRQDPQQATALTKLGDLALLRGAEDEARAHFTAALALDPEDRRAHQRLGLILARRGEPARAIAHLEHGIIGTAPDYLGVKLELGLLYVAAGRHADAVGLLGEQPGLERNGGLGLVILAMATLGTGNAARGLDLAERALALRPTDPAAVQLLAAARRAGQPAAQSDQRFEALVLASPAASLATYDLVGSRLQATGAFDRAEAVFRAMRARFPGEAGAAFRLGTFLAFLTRYDEAAEALAEAASLDPARPEIWRARALAASRLGQKEAAVGFAQTMLARAPQPGAEDRFLLAALREEAGDRAGAEAEYRALLRLGPYPPAQNNLANLLLDRGDLTGGLTQARAAAAAAPDAFWAQSTLGWALLRNRDTGAARVALLRARALQPEDPTILYHLAEVEAARGELATARQLVADALARGPFPKQARARALSARLGPGPAR